MTFKGPFQPKASCDSTKSPGTNRTPTTPGSHTEGASTESCSWCSPSLGSPLTAPPTPGLRARSDTSPSPRQSPAPKWTPPHSARGVRDNAALGAGKGAQLRVQAGGRSSQHRQSFRQGCAAPAAGRGCRQQCCRKHCGCSPQGAWPCLARPTRHWSLPRHPQTGSTGTILDPGTLELGAPTTPPQTRTVPNQES